MEYLEIEERPPSELLRQHALILNELGRRKILRGGNNPVGDLAEWLATKALNLKLADNSTRGYDALDAAGKRYQIKGRRVTSGKPSRQLSSIRDIKHQQFDFLVGIIFGEFFEVERACLMPYEVVSRRTRRDRHVRGDRLVLRDGLWNEPGVRDITPEITDAARSLEGACVTTCE
jgi:hypothetical protein